MPEQVKSGEKLHRGVAVSSGICRGKIFILGPRDGSVPRRELADAELPGELKRLEQAILQTRQQIGEVQRQVSEGLGEKDARIFDAHLLVLEDPSLIDEVTAIIARDKVNVEHAFRQAADKYIKALSAINDEYLRERAGDMRDVTERILNNLLNRHQGGELNSLTEPCIIISEDLTPSQTAVLDKKMVLGFATDAGSKTSHTAIMARALQIPAVVGLKNASRKLRSGDYALLDGYNGQIIVNPTDQTLFEYGQLVRKQVNIAEKLRDVIDKPAVTLDGVLVTLSANIEQAADVGAVRACGAEGVGLFRTEYLFINRDRLPTEEEQFQEYRAVAVALNPAPVIIRTLDLGGDKFTSHLDAPKEMNPFLGWRAIRLCLQEPEIFRTQLRAILRASTQGNLQLMYPMISGVDELNQANALLEKYKAELRDENIPFDPALGAGIMIEIPSAAVVADHLARRVKFFSIGTNDLIQYTLAVDRLNDKIAHLYEPTHPAILRLIRTTAEAGAKNGVPTGVCGEMAGDPVLVPLLLGLGCTSLSATPALIPQVKFLIRRLKMSEARALADFAIECDSGAEILRRAQDLARGVAPSLFETQPEPTA